MARFCTQCGGANEDHARFCEHCGKPVKQASAPGAPAAAAPAAVGHTGGRRGLLVGAAAVIVLAAAGGGLAWWLAPESASEASFARAIDAHFSKDEGARDRLLCSGNLPYGTNPIRVNEFDGGTRRYMDMLAQAGVYEPPQTASSGGYFPRTQHVYALSDEGKKWVRNNRLCLGTGLQAKRVSGFERVEEIQGKPFAMASAQMEVTGEAPWLAGAADREALLQEMNKQSLSVSLPLARVDSQWAVTSLDPSAQRVRQASLSGATERNAGGTGLFDKLKSLFSFGAGHPLVGKWQDESGLFALEFTSDAYVQDGISVKARFETRGDEVTITPEAAGGAGLVLKMRDSNTALIDMGLATLTLKRVQ